MPNTTIPTKTAIIYCRVTSRRPDDAVNTQLDECRALASRMKAVVNQEFVDCGQARLDKERPGLRALLDLLVNETLDFVICTDMSRLARSYADLTDIVRHIEAHGSQLVLAGPGVLLTGAGEDANDD